MKLLTAILLAVVVSFQRSTSASPVQVTMPDFEIKHLRHDPFAIRKIAARKCIKNYDPVHFKTSAKECHDCVLTWNKPMFENEDEDKLIHRIVYDCTTYFNITHFLLTKCASGRNHGYHYTTAFFPPKSVDECLRCYLDAGLNLNGSAAIVTFDEYVQARQKCVRTGTSSKTIITSFRGRSFRDLRYQYDFETTREQYVKHCEDHFDNETVRTCRLCIRDTFLAEDMNPDKAVNKLRKCLPQLNAVEQMALACRAAETRNRVMRFLRTHQEQNEARRRAEWEKNNPDRPYPMSNITHLEFKMHSLSECRTCFANENLAYNDSLEKKQAASFRCTPPLHPKLEMSSKLCQKIRPRLSLKLQGHPNKRTGTLNERRHYGNRTYYFGRNATKSCNRCVQAAPVNINSTFDEYRSAFRECAQQVVDKFRMACMKVASIAARKQCSQCITQTLGGITQLIAVERRVFLQGIQCVLDAQDVFVLQDDPIQVPKLESPDDNDVSVVQIASPSLGPDGNGGGPSVRYDGSDR